MADLMVVAPSGPRSGASGSITSEHPLRCKKIESAPGFSLYSCTGTPVDCVKLALHDLVPRTPDMVIGGINHGDNSSVNVHYSGTMGVVIEGCLKKYLQSVFLFVIMRKMQILRPLSLIYNVS